MLVNHTHRPTHSSQHPLQPAPTACIPPPPLSPPNHPLSHRSCHPASFKPPTPSPNPDTHLLIDHKAVCFILVLLTAFLLFAAVCTVFNVLTLRLPLIPLPLPLCIAICFAFCIVCVSVTVCKLLFFLCGQQGRGQGCEQQGRRGVWVAGAAWAGVGGGKRVSRVHRSVWVCPQDRCVQQD